MRAASSDSALRRKRLGAGLRRGRLGRQLGPRSGAIFNMLANKVWAPELEGLGDKRFGLMRENLISKDAIGTAGLDSIMRFIQNRYNTRADRDAQSSGGGVLDWVNPLATLAGTVFGGPVGGAAANTVTKQQ